MPLERADTQKAGLTRPAFVRARGIHVLLPAVMSKGLVGLRHAINVVLALPSRSLLLRRIQDLAREPLGHRVLAAVAGEVDQPADRQRARPPRGHLDRHLVGGTADPARANLEHRGKLLDRGLERLDCVLAGALADESEGARLRLASRIAAGGKDLDPADAHAPAGIALALTRLLKELPFKAGSTPTLIPTDVAARHGASVAAFDARRVSPGVIAACAELRALARDELAEAERRLKKSASAILPAFIPLAPLRLELDRHGITTPVVLVAHSYGGFVITSL